ncbi:hypothetical protein SeMB42_g00654 [Synchytrium endobioticum]|uniref:PUM-HD domain-containing protein n=1 Tax=Synchytrium endobioticum TaxID=286115 RepID=A0A507DQX2_9FUNG|nr:hypothetical protein SeMB42_g00654 [Synchytrium endobioticum]
MESPRLKSATTTTSTIPLNTPTPMQPSDAPRYSNASSTIPSVPPPSFFLESVHETSELDHPSPSSAHSSSSHSSGNSHYSKIGQLHLSPSLASGLRRTRAETFSSYNNNKMLKETEPILPSSSPGGRARAGSLSLPANNLTAAFGPSLFATSWQPGQPQTPTTPITSNVNISADFMIGGSEETASLVRTLDMLGLDEPVEKRIGSPMTFNGGGVHALFGRTSGDNSVYNSAPASSPNASANGTLAPPAATSPSHLRSRSYSMAVGEQLSITIPNPHASILRPRATSIAYMESTFDNETTPNRKPASERLARTDIDSPTILEKLTMTVQTYVGESSPTAASLLNGFGPDSPTAQEQIPTRSLWIGNIDTTISPADLLSLFAPFGVIESLRILTDKECAFVNYVRVEDAIRARDEMQGSKVGNCVVRVGFGKAESISENQGMQPTKSLWIGNIPPMTEPAELENIFRVFGPIESARVLTHKNCGFINYERLEDAMEARKAMNGREIGGSVVKINFAKVPSISTPGSSPDHERTHNFILSTPTRPPPTTTPMSTPGLTTLYGGGAIPTLMGGIPNMTTTNGMPLMHLVGQPVLNGYDSHLNSSSESLDLSMMPFDSDSYAPAIPPLPEPRANRRVDQNRLRDMRKRLEGHITLKEVDLIYQEIVEDTVDLCTDYIGNVVIQKIVDKSTDQHRLRLLEKVAPHMAAVGIHKNGTWAVQKMIDSAKTTQQIQVIVTALRPYTPPLLLDQFGNYVVQCCLRLGPHRNQFVFDSMHTKCLDIAQGRFGARAMRACLESQYTTKRQQKHVAIAIVQNSVQLCTNPNGAILITWLLDTSSLPGRYRVLAPKLAPHIASLCTHKLASATILKLVTQRIEMDARDVIIKTIFFGEDAVLEEVLSDQVHGVSVIQKILASACVSIDEKIRLGERTRQVLNRMPELQDNAMGYKRLLDELAVIPSAAPALGTETSLTAQDIVSPLTPQSTFTFANPSSNEYFPSHLPTPSGSPSPPTLGYTGSAQISQPNFSASTYYMPATPPHNLSKNTSMTTSSLLSNLNNISSSNPTSNSLLSNPSTASKYGTALAQSRYPLQFGSLSLDGSQ